MKPRRPLPKAKGAATPSSTTPLLLNIEKPIYGGAFLGRDEGKAVFVPLTLPGEQVRVRIVENKRGYASAEIEQIVAPSPERIVPACSHFGVCGGCNYQHTAYENQIGLKKAILRETFERAGVRVEQEIDAISASPWGYRNRIRLAVNSVGELGYRGRRSHAIAPISECPIAAPLLLNAAMAARETLQEPAAKMPATEISLFSNADETSLLATVFASSADNIRFDRFASALRERIPVLAGAELVVAGPQPQTAARWGADAIEYRAGGFGYRVDHSAFFQVNRWLVDSLLGQVTAGQRGELAWDLYAGVGLFARRLAGSFSKVIAVESAPSATAALEQNLAGTSGFSVIADTLSFLRRQGSAARPDLIVVDPPRTGLGAEITSLLGEVSAPAIMYVSCDPATLARDLRALVGTGYAIRSITLADLFPQTYHLETVVHLSRD